MSNNLSSNGIGLFSVIGIVFVILKLVHVINWNWWWITLPFWGGFAFVLLLIIAIPTCIILAKYFLKFCDFLAVIDKKHSWILHVVFTLIIIGLILFFFK